MLEIKLPGKSPGLKLILSILKKQNASGIDWFLAHVASKNFNDYISKSPEASTLKSIYLEATKLFIEDIKSVCESASPDTNPGPLTQYLLRGRGILLISALQKTVSFATVFNDELCAVLLSLVSFLCNSAPEACDHDRNSTNNVLQPVSPSTWPRVSSGYGIVRKRRKPSYRGQKIRRRAASRTVFPDATTINTSRNVGENLTEWEGSPSSDDHDTDVASICATLPNQIKYIPINYFAYFDNANLESDEFTDQTVNHLPQPPPLPQVSCTRPQMVETCLFIVCHMMSHATKSPAMTSKTQNAMLQLGVVACNQLKCNMSEVAKSQLLSIICHCVSSVRYRPDLVLSQPLQTILGCLISILSVPRLGLNDWTHAAICSLTVWRDLTAANTELAALSGIINLVSAVLQGLINTSWQVTNVLKCLVSLLQDIPDSDFVFNCVNKILDIISSNNCSNECQEAGLHHLINLFSSYCYPADQLVKLTSKVEFFSNSVNFELYLRMLETLMDNMAESEHRWPGASLMGVKEVDRDSAVSSSEDVIEENNNRSNEANVSSSTEFEPYLSILTSGESDKIEKILNHLEHVVGRADGETRHKIALHVLLPFLVTNNKSSSDDPKDQITNVESVLQILSQLVAQQPTAMALIRNQSVWRQIKYNASVSSHLSTPSQLVIKNIVLNSNKFIKIRLSEAEAMALQDDENDIINFDQRDKNAQCWLFKQFYHVLIQSSVPVINGDILVSYSHLSSAWTIALDLVTNMSEFLIYSIERGAITLGLQLLNAIGTTSCRSVIAESVGRIVQFLTFVLSTRPSWEAKVPNMELSIESLYEEEIETKLKSIMSKATDIRVMKIVLSHLLEASSSKSSRSTPLQLDTISDDGYEADQSDVEELDKKSNHLPEKISILSTQCIRLFSWGLNLIINNKDYGTSQKLFTMEYLLYKFSKLDLSDRETIRILNDGVITSLLDVILDWSLSSDQQQCQMVLVFIFQIISQVASKYLSPITIKKIFKLLNTKSSLQAPAYTLFTDLLMTRINDYHIPGVSIIGTKTRDRLSSTLSSDSGLDSNISLSSSSMPLSSSRKYFIKDPVDDLEKDYTIILRIKIDVSPNRSHDEWIELVSVENRHETLGVQVNLVKGLRMTLANAKGTFAAAETNFHAIFEPGKWTHLVLNIGTVSEGSRNTKTLSAFIDCCRVWDVGLSVDNKVNAKVKRDRFLSLVVGHTCNNSSMVGLDVKASDVFFIGNSSYSLQDIVQDYLTESKYLMLTNQPSTRINLKRLGDKLPDLIGYFLPLVSGESPLCISGNDDRKVVAHFSPTGLWNSRTFPTLQSDTCDTWTLQRGIFSGKDSYKKSLLLIMLSTLKVNFNQN